MVDQTDHRRNELFHGRRNRVHVESVLCACSVRPPCRGRVSSRNFWSSSLGLGSSFQSVRSVRNAFHMKIPRRPPRSYSATPVPPACKPLAPRKQLLQRSVRLFSGQTKGINRFPRPLLLQESVSYTIHTLARLSSVPLLDHLLGGLCSQRDGRNAIITIA
jgi:hypothetical protein